MKADPVLVGSLIVVFVTVVVLFIAAKWAATL